MNKVTRTINVEDIPKMPLHILKEMLKKPLPDDVKRVVLNTLQLYGY